MTDLPKIEMHMIPSRRKKQHNDILRCREMQNEPTI